MFNVDNLDIVPYPHPALRWVSKPISKITTVVQDVVKKMIELMHEYKGAGLSANQVAIPWSIFVTFVNEKEMVFINPEIHYGKNKRDTAPKIIFDHEGCLSFPGLIMEEKVPRSRDIYIEALDINGNPFTIGGPGLFSRVIQHEYDHLRGVLLIDRVTLKKETKNYLEYLVTQYECLTSNSNKPKFGNDEEEKNKLMELELFLLRNEA